MAQIKNEQLVDTAIKRSATKIFDKSKIISESDFKCLLEIAQYSPSSMGLEPWNLIVLQNSEIRQEIRPFASGAQRQLDSCSHFVIFTVKTDLDPESPYFKHICLDIKDMDIESYQAFVIKLTDFQKQRLGVTDSRAKIDWASKQAYIAMGNMMFAASLLGIDSCPIEGFIPSEVKRILLKHSAISKEDHIAVMLALGYKLSDGNSHKKNRRKLNEIVKYV